ncbi:MAG: hypothetical protein E7J86_20715 [Aeromonas caviae]|nr:hypothetical protein [Aeromonas caviae]
MASTIGHDEGRREDDKGAVRQEKLQVEYINTVTYCIFHHEISERLILNTAPFPKTGKVAPP